jgi:hypothetical protein
MAALAARGAGAPAAAPYRQGEARSRSSWQSSARSNRTGSAAGCGAAGHAAALTPPRRQWSDWATPARSSRAGTTGTSTHGRLRAPPSGCEARSWRSMTPASISCRSADLEESASITASRWSAARSHPADPRLARTGAGFPGAAARRRAGAGVGTGCLSAARPAAAHRRRGLGRRLDPGVRALNLFTPCCRGQRIGIFAGSEGTSTPLAMLAWHSNARQFITANERCANEGKIERQSS